MPMHARRLWRVRRQHDHIDAALGRSERDWTLEFRRNDRLLVSLRFTARDDAAAVAAGRLRELQRAGWNEHW
jgi:hypothetical protein